MLFCLIFQAINASAVLVCFLNVHRLIAACELQNWPLANGLELLPDEHRGNFETRNPP